MSKKSRKGGYYTTDVFLKNLNRKLNKHLSKHPNDLQSTKGLERTEVRRKKPKSTVKRDGLFDQLKRIAIRNSPVPKFVIA